MGRPAGFVYHEPSGLACMLATGPQGAKVHLVRDPGVDLSLCGRYAPFLIQGRDLGHTAGTCQTCKRLAARLSDTREEDA